MAFQAPLAVNQTSGVPTLSASADLDHSHILVYATPDQIYILVLLSMVDLTLLTPDISSKTFYSVEYRDEENELNIKHVFMTAQETEILLEEFRKRGIIATIYPISHTPATGVTSENGTTAELERFDPDRFK